MTYYNRDTERTIYRMVNFCGKMRKTTSGNKLIKDSCYVEENIEGGFDVEACAMITIFAIILQMFFFNLIGLLLFYSYCIIFEFNQRLR